MSAKDFEIEPVFKIPKRYFKRFVYVHEELRMDITASGKTGKIRFRASGDPKTYSPELDWIQEAIERVRWECGKKAK